jgi:hypothetical protein
MLGKRMISMRYSPRQIIVFSFTALSIASAVYISIATVNYLRFFPALPEIQNSFQLDSLTLVRSTTSTQSTLKLLLNVTNPSQFVGFQLTDVVLTLYFYLDGNMSKTLFVPPANQPNATRMLNMPLGPNQMDLVTISIQLDASQTNQLVMFTQTYPMQVVGNVILTIDISTFLLSVTGALPYTRIQDIFLSVSS